MLVSPDPDKVTSHRDLKLRARLRLGRRQLHCLVRRSLGPRFKPDLQPLLYAAQICTCWVRQLSEFGQGVDEPAKPLEDAKHHLAHGHLVRAYRAVAAAKIGSSKLE